MHSIDIQICSDRMVLLSTTGNFRNYLLKLIQRLVRYISVHRLKSIEWIFLRWNEMVMLNMIDRKVDWHNMATPASNTVVIQSLPSTHSLPCLAWCATISVCRASVGSCNCRWCFRNANCHYCRSTKLNCYSRCLALTGRATTPATTVNSISAHTMQSLLIYCPDIFPA